MILICGPNSGTITGYIKIYTAPKKKFIPTEFQQVPPGRFILRLASLEHSIPQLSKCKAQAGGLGKVMELVARHHPTDILMIHPKLKQNSEKGPMYRTLANESREGKRWKNGTQVLQNMCSLLCKMCSWLCSVSHFLELVDVIDVPHFSKILQSNGTPPPSFLGNAINMCFPFILMLDYRRALSFNP